MLTTKQAAEYIGISKTYLRNMRHMQCTSDGPKCVEGRSPRGKTWYYGQEDLDEWAKQHDWRKDKPKPVDSESKQPIKRCLACFFAPCRCKEGLKHKKL